MCLRGACRLLARYAGRSHVQSSLLVLRYSVSLCEIRCLRALRYLSSENVPGSIGAFGTTSSNAIVFVSPLVKVIFIVSSSSDVLSIHRSSFARFSLLSRCAHGSITIHLCVLNPRNNSEELKS